MIKRPTLSVSMIVKNEAPMIGAILRDCKSFADEIVVCDTGSTDETVEIAKSMGARIVRFPWNDNFADARNHSLAACNGKYVLWVDADDRIVKSQQKQIQKLKRHYLEHGPYQAYLINVMIANASRCVHSMEQFRLFPKINDEMWEGAIHEAPLKEIWKSHMDIASTDIWIYHEGYWSQEILMSKVRRNVELLRKDAAERPTTIIKSYLGGSLADIGEMDEALGVMADIYDDNYLKHTKGQRFLYFMRLYNILFHKKEFVALWGAMEEAKKVFDDPQPWSVQAQIAFVGGKYELAKELCVEGLTKKLNKGVGVPVIPDCGDRMMRIIKQSNAILGIEETAKEHELLNMKDE